MPQSGWTRRDLLRNSLLSAGALGMGKASAASPARSCIFLFLVGGPSQLDTWDPKPDAPSHVRGDTRSLRTNVSGIRISENFPRMARRADKYALIRGCHHTALAVHDTGCQLMQTGRLFENGVEHPHIGCVAAKAFATTPHFLLGGPIGNTGGNMPHGQTAGPLGPEYEPVALSAARSGVAYEPGNVRARYGATPFGENCLAARRLVERGARFVTVNMFHTVFDTPTWDIHGTAPFTSIKTHREIVCPMFDQAYSALVEDLSARGLLESTMVVATGEFGRSPRINAAGGRDHWPQCWTLCIAGGGVCGGQVIGSSDAIAAEPKERPVSPPEVIATIAHGLRLPQGAVPSVSPIYELFV